MDFGRDDLACLESVSVYVAIALTAMQVGLSTQSLADNATFQPESRGFTIFSILCPLVIAALLVLIYGCMLLYNGSVTMVNTRRRFHPYRQDQPPPESMDGTLSATSVLTVSGNT
jgi:hypothetical protein